MEGLLLGRAGTHGMAAATAFGGSFADSHKKAVEGEGQSGLGFDGLSCVDLFGNMRVPSWAIRLRHTLLCVHDPWLHVCVCVCVCACS